MSHPASRSSASAGGTARSAHTPGCGAAGIRPAADDLWLADTNIRPLCLGVCVCVHSHPTDICIMFRSKPLMVPFLMQCVAALHLLMNVAQVLHRRRAHRHRGERAAKFISDGIEDTCPMPHIVACSHPHTIPSPGPTPFNIRRCCSIGPCRSRCHASGRTGYFPRTHRRPR